MKTALILLVLAIVGIPALIYLVGSMLPIAHTASVTRLLKRPPAAVATLIREVARQPEWRKDVSAIEIISPSPVLTYKEANKHGTITFELHELQRDHQFESRIVDKSLPFGGKWIFLLTEEAGGTRITIREEGEVYSPLFRFFARFVFGHDKTLNGYADALSTALST